MHKKLIAAVAVVAVAALITLSVWHTKGASAESRAPVVAAAPTMAQIQQIALSAAARNGEPEPSDVEEASGTLGLVAGTLMPGRAGPNLTDPETGKPLAESIVDVVTMRGHFTYDGPMPPGVPAPTGTVLSLVIDAHSGFVDGESLGSSTPDLHDISPTVTSLGDDHE
jgi:hypothetical protein